MKTPNVIVIMNEAFSDLSILGEFGSGSFFIWANYDIEEETNIEMSVNYLAAKVLEVSGMKLPPYFSFLSDYKEEYPVVTANYAVDSAGNYIELERFEKYLGEYTQMQYYVFNDLK